MSKQIKVTKKPAATTQAGSDKAQKFWLAGLGAFSIAQKQGNAVYESMVSEGRSFQTRSEKLARKVSGQVTKIARSRLKPVQARLLAVRLDAEAMLERGVGRVLSYAGIPSKADVDALISRVDALSRQLRAAK